MVKDVAPDLSLHSFDHFTTHYNVPSSYLFRNMQLSYAFKSQFPPGTAQLVASDLKRFLCYVQYAQKNTPCSSPAGILSQAICALSALVPGCSKLNSEDWEDIWDISFKILMSLGDRLIQFMVVHRAYLTSYWLRKKGDPLILCHVGAVITP